MFSVGINELILIVVIAAVVALLASLRHRSWKWGAVALVCAVVATVITPAELVSTVFLGAIFFLFFLAGAQWGKWARLAAA